MQINCSIEEHIWNASWRFVCQSVEHSLRFGLDLLNVFKPASFQLQFHFWAGDETDLVFLLKQLDVDGSVGRIVIIVVQPDLF
jgi:hypothetical protein